MGALPPRAQKTVERPARVRPAPGCHRHMQSGVV